MNPGETPEFAAIAAEFDDPYPVLAEITEATEQPPPCIQEAHASHEDSDLESDLCP